MSTIDWSALGIWVQAVFVAAGTIFAVCQYLGFKKNERVKRTLRLLSDFDTVRHMGTSGVEMTVARALPLVQAARANVAGFKAGWADFMAANDTALGRQYARMSDAVTMTVNYFNDAERLIKRNLIDKDLFLEARSYMMTLVLDPAKELLQAEGRPYDLSDLEAFVEEARQYLKEHPIAAPTD